MSRPETLQTQPLEYYLALAKKTPRVHSDELISNKLHNQFGNNFYLLFVERRLKEQNPVDSEIAYMEQIARAEGTGGKWLKFVSQNKHLIKAIEDSIGRARPYYEMREYINELLSDKRVGEAVSFSNQVANIVGNPLGIELYGLFAWNKINPLLEKAAEEMKKAGINPEEFYN